MHPGSFHLSVVGDSVPRVKPVPSRVPADNKFSSCKTTIHLLEPGALSTNPIVLNEQFILAERTRYTFKANLTVRSVPNTGKFQTLESGEYTFQVE